MMAHLQSCKEAAHGVKTFFENTTGTLPIWEAMCTLSSRFGKIPPTLQENRFELLSA